MFDEIERVSQGGNTNGESKLFEIEGITNRDIGKKIKSFSKFFLKFTIAIYIIALVIIFFASAAMADEGGLIFFLIYLVVFGIGFVASYYGFLIMSGFGALVEDVNAIKVLKNKSDVNKPKKEKYEDLPTL